MAIKSTEQSRWLLKNKVQFLLSNGNLSIISSIAVLLIFSYAQWDAILYSRLHASWAIFGVTLAVTRLSHVFVFQRQKKDINYPFWLNSYRVLTFLSGLLYSLLVYLFFDIVNANYQVIILFIVVGVTSAAVATHGVDKLTFRLFSLTIILSTMLFLFLHRDADYNVMLGLMCLVLLVMERAAKQTNKTMNDNFELTFSMKYRATHDPLVGLFNRFELESQFDQRFSNSKHGIALMFLDLDNFKPLNDNFGHEAGDEALIFVANAIRKRIRSDDVAARLGGDEFVILLSLDDIEVVQRLAANIRTDIETLFSTDQRMLKVSCSIGIAFISEHHDIGFSRVLREADIACYESKSQGKNRVTTRLVHQDN